MTHTPQREPIPGARRLVQIAMAAGLVAALSAAGPIPLAFSADQAPAAADPGVKSAAEKLGSDDADLLAEAKAMRRQERDADGRHGTRPDRAGRRMI